MGSFADLGIPFPLFEAPTKVAAGYRAAATCRLCLAGDRPCFEVDFLVVDCRGCGSRNGLYLAGLRRPVACRTCAGPIPFPEGFCDELPAGSRRDDQVLACYQCLRAGRAAVVKQTEFGLVGVDEALSGVTGGVPGLKTDQFAAVVLDENWTDASSPGEQDVWSGARVPSEHLWELLGTPTYLGWQGEQWLFCCGEPMTYLGNWPDVIARFHPEDPDALFAQIYATTGDEWPATARDFESHDPEMYVFRCRRCERLRAHFDGG